MRHARARLEKATVLREIVVVRVLASPSRKFACDNADGDRSYLIYNAEVHQKTVNLDE